MAIDDPLVSIAHGPGRNQGGVGPGPGLGHGERAAKLPVEQWEQPPFPLLLPAR